MTAPIRSLVAADVLRAGELHAEWLPYRHRDDGSARGVVVGLSHDTRVAGCFAAPYDQDVRELAASGLAVVVPGTSGSAWGNDDAIDGIDRAIEHLRRRRGCQHRVALLGYSTGALAVCGWARAHPHEVAALALVTPVLDLELMHEHPSYAVEIERAHGGGTTWRGSLPEHDPRTFAAELRSIPTRVWCASDDPLIPPASVGTFAARHGGDISVEDLGSVGHDPAAAPSDAIARFLTARR